MPSDLSSYLATHYLTTDAKPAKKRKRKQAAESGLVIQDDDDSAWASSARKGNSGGDDDDDPERAATVAGTSAEFRRSKKSNWKTVGGLQPSASSTSRAGEDADAAAADAILADTAAEKAAAQADDDEGPAIEGSGGGRSGVAMMSDGTHAGLQSAATISAQLERRREQERAELEEMNKERKARARARRRAGGGGAEEGGGDESPPEEEQLVLRDATGRRVDVSMRRAEARRAAAEAEEQARREEEAKKRALRGEVQLEAARQRRERLEDAALMPLARGADDTEMNAELKAQQRWNDPMAQFLGGDGDDGTAAGGPSRGKSKKKGLRPVYKGAAPPNRYGIRPGYRWDGVDRGNGFEAERFKAINRRERNKGLDYAWQMDE